MSKKNEATVAAEQPKTDELSSKIQAITSDSKLNVSQKIRALDALGRKRGEIVKDLTNSGYKTKNGGDIRFQHVRNVLITPIKKTA